MFVRGGNVNPGNYLGGAGYVGDYWSSVGNTSNYAYYLNFNPNGIYPSIGYGLRNSGFSVRCVALGG